MGAELRPRRHHHPRGAVPDAGFFMRGKTDMGAKKPPMPKGAKPKGKPIGGKKGGKGNKAPY